MRSKTFAVVSGFILLLVGFFAFIPFLSSGVPDGVPQVNLETSYGFFLERFPMNVLNKIALVAFGIAGIWAGVTRSDVKSNPQSVAAIGNVLPVKRNRAVIYSRVLFYTMGALAILGLIPQTNTLFGQWPLFGNEVWAHALIAVFGFYFGYVADTSSAKESTWEGQDLAHQ